MVSSFVGITFFTYLLKSAETSLFDQFGIDSIYDDYSTNNDRVFVAGDARRGPSLVIWGIREGRKTAEKIDQGLRVMLAQ